MTEFGFIENIARMFGQVPTRGFEGIGDDCAVLPLDDERALVFTTDLLVEDVHFLRSAASAFEIGRKSLAVNLSDVAAMGAEPVASLLSIALTDETAGEWAEEFMQGYHDLSEQWSVPLVGGDTSRSKSGVTINITAIGRVKPSDIKRRSAARAGDVVVVGGPLGGSAAGLRDILADRSDTALAHLHRNPEPQIAEGLWLGRRREVHAMMDLSDGLASDLGHILRASGVGAEIETENIPTVATIEDAVCGGEDYKLLFTVAAEAADDLLREFAERFGCEARAIGHIVGAYTGEIVWLCNGRQITHDWHGFTHF